MRPADSDGRSIWWAAHSFQKPLTLRLAREQTKSFAAAVVRALDASGQRVGEILLVCISDGDGPLTLLCHRELEFPLPVEGRAEGAHLALQHSPHGFVCCIARHQVVHVDRGALADAMAAVFGLQELARRPAQLSKDSGARGSEREALAGGEDRKEEDGWFARRKRLEAVDERGALDGRHSAVDAESAHAGGGGGGADGIEHRLMMSKEQESLARREHLQHEVRSGLCLCSAERDAHL